MKKQFFNILAVGFMAWSSGQAFGASEVVQGEAGLDSTTGNYVEVLSLSEQEAARREDLKTSYLMFNGHVETRCQQMNAWFQRTYLNGLSNSTMLHRENFYCVADKGAATFTVNFEVIVEPKKPTDQAAVNTYLKQRENLMLGTTKLAFLTANAVVPITKIQSGLAPLSGNGDLKVTHERLVDQKMFGNYGAYWEYIYEAGEKLRRDMPLDLIAGLTNLLGADTVRYVYLPTVLKTVNYVRARTTPVFLIDGDTPPDTSLFATYFDSDCRGFAGGFCLK